MTRSQQKESVKTCLALLEELSETATTVEQEAGRRVEVRTELGERGNVTVLGEVQLERTGDGLHDLRESQSESESWSVTDLQIRVRVLCASACRVEVRNGSPEREE